MTAVNDGDNANPMSMRAALRAFAEMAVEGRKFWRWGRCWSWGRGGGASAAGRGWRGGLGGGGGGVAGDADGYVGGGGATRLAAGAAEVRWLPAAQAAAWLRARLRQGCLALKASRVFKLKKF